MRRKIHPPQPRDTKPKAPAGLLELDRFNEVAIGRWLDLSRDLDQLEDDLFFGVQPEQRRKKEDIHAALGSVAPVVRDLTGWVRIVTYQY